MSESPKNAKQLSGIEILEKHLRQSGRTMKEQEARYMVDMYYTSQAHRIRMESQIRAMDGREPHAALDWVLKNAANLEECVKKILGEFAAARQVGAWSQSICGIGPVISAGLLAHIDGAGSNTVSRIWRFAGLDPDAKWYGREEAKKIVASLPDQIDGDALAIAGQRVKRQPWQLRLHAYNFSHRDTPAANIDEIGDWMPTKAELAKALSMRPWNARLKVLCWKIGQSFVKVSGNESDFYGKLYKQRKERDTARNEAGELADAARRALEAKEYGKDTEAFKAYSQGKLPKAHIQARAERYAVKIFLSHWHTVAYYEAHGKLPPKPYVLDILGHADEIQVPNWPFETVPVTATNG